MDQWEVIRNRIPNVEHVATLLHMFEICNRSHTCPQVILNRSKAREREARLFLQRQSVGALRQA